MGYGQGKGQGSTGPAYGELLNGPKTRFNLASGGPLKRPRDQRVNSFPLVARSAALLSSFRPIRPPLIPVLPAAPATPPPVQGRLGGVRRLNGARAATSTDGGVTRGPPASQVVAAVGFFQAAAGPEGDCSTSRRRIRCCCAWRDIFVYSGRLAACNGCKGSFNLGQ
jgi:hypothetical protein